MGGTDTSQRSAGTDIPTSIEDYKLDSASLQPLLEPRSDKHVSDRAVCQSEIEWNNMSMSSKFYLPRRHLHFRLTLVDALTKSYLQQRILKEAPVNQQSMNKKQWEADLSRLTGAHHPTHLHTNDNQRFEGNKRPRNEESNVRYWVVS